ncbi:MAG TPA: roadblock/LC7 domain-containing protein [Kofleriaceae bacterium]|jgi:predicted regulator of Ras-like GTPase activity (Roadblock/LC7/MglB family)|nr:roadblock/LC7 domain-containing protein [Kofleriaceae bacterium]
MSSLPQIARAQIARLPEVTALVVTDRVGALLEYTGEIDGEALGAVHMVTAQALMRCGNSLGLGPLHRITISSPRHPCLIAVHDDDVLAVYVDPSKPLGAFERKLEAALRR